MIVPASLMALQVLDVRGLAFSDGSNTCARSPAISIAGLIAVSYSVSLAVFQGINTKQIELRLRVASGAEGVVIWIGAFGRPRQSARAIFP